MPSFLAQDESLAVFVHPTGTSLLLMQTDLIRRHLLVLCNIVTDDIGLLWLELVIMISGKSISFYLDAKFEKSVDTILGI